MRKILSSMLVIGLVATASYIGFSRAFFFDTEKSTGNTITAGKLDLKVDSTAHYAGMVCSYVDPDGDSQVYKPGYYWVEETTDSSIRPELINTSCVGTWELKDLGQGDVFFNLTDVKPGDMGENTISLHVEDNNAWACATINPTVNDDVSSTEPELESGDVADTDSIFDGELAQNMKFGIWADTCVGDGLFPGDNVYTPGCDTSFYEGTGGPITPLTFAIADKNSNIFTDIAGDPLVGKKDYFIGVSWSLPSTVGNIVQSDTYVADISFYVEQSRNNPNFTCSVPTQADTLTLRLENETPVVGGPWQVIVDNKYVDMTYNASGPTFNYSLTGQGLAEDTKYALIYYADGWPGNNPGALIGEWTTDEFGNITTGGIINEELGMDLPTAPDGNLAIGAKIWLIPSAAYNAATNSVIVWPPDYNTWFFEGNVYIKYNDTDIP